MLDPGLGRKLRDLVDSIEDMQEPKLKRCMEVTFERIVMTSTFVERIFKELTNMTKQCQSIGSVGAKHVNAAFAAGVNR